MHNDLLIACADPVDGGRDRRRGVDDDEVAGVEEARDLAEARVPDAVGVRDEQPDLVAREST